MMNTNIQPLTDTFKTYPYEYARYMKKSPYAAQKMQETQRYVKQECKREEYVYPQQTVHEEEFCNYEQPNLPYYVVPVLYVPKRVIPNEEIQAATAFGTQAALANQERERQRYYCKTYDPSSEYLYNDCYEGNNKDINGQGDDDVDYYNMQYCCSSSTIRDDITENYPAPYHEATCSYTYVSKTRPDPTVRPLKSQTACQNIELDKRKVRAKCRSTYVCNEPRVGDYITPDYKSYYSAESEKYFYSLKPSYQKFRPHFQLLDENTPQSDKESNIVEYVIKTVPSKIDNCERATQTLESKINVITMCTQTEADAKERRTNYMRSSSKGPNAKLDSYIQTSECTVHEEKDQSPIRRSIPIIIKKKPTTTPQSVEQRAPPTDSPVRRLRKFS